MAGLADYVSVRSRFARSANLERDSGRPEPFDGYIVTARALDVIERMTGAALSGRSGGAWSLTGPYGSGKSSLALLLDAAFGPGKRVRNVVLSLIAEASPEAAETVRKAHERHGTRRTGFHRGLVTANREPITHTLLRALHAAVVGTYGRIPPARDFPASRLLKEALRDLETTNLSRSGPAASVIVEVARCLAERAPLLLVVDEFGKTLEAIRDGGDADRSPTRSPHRPPERRARLRPLVRGFPRCAAVAPDALVHPQHEDQADRDMDRGRVGGLLRGDPGRRGEPEGVHLHQAQHHEPVPVRRGRH